LRWLLTRMGVRFVERDDVHASVEDAKRLVQAAKAGECLVFFPEGTFGRAPKLRSFHMGAFVAANRCAPSALHGRRPCACARHGARTGRSRLWGTAACFLSCSAAGARIRQPGVAVTTVS
jgi:1-acyl-sn-glycerol-3-phosphate acyltransferase